MPLRKVPLVNGEYYHVFNRTQNKEPVFVNARDCRRAVGAISYYRYLYLPLKFSHFLLKGSVHQEEILKRMESFSKLVDVITYCLMPNHFHLLLRQDTDGGISRFLALFQNSITKYRNTKYKKEGHLFSGRFKAVRIEDESQLLHVHRYIHLNPYTSYVVKNIADLENYPYSSFREYLGLDEGFCNKNVILSSFSNIDEYKKFVFNQADYQRELKKITHLVFD